MFFVVSSQTLKAEVKRISDYGAVINQSAHIIQGSAKGGTNAAMGMLKAGDGAAMLMLEGPGSVTTSGHVSLP